MAPGASLAAMAKAAKEKSSKLQKTASKKEDKKPSQPAPISSEFIEESDEDSESDSESEIEDEKTTTKPIVPAPTTNGKTIVPEDSSSESGSQSGSEDSSSEEDEDADEEMADAGTAPVGDSDVAKPPTAPVVAPKVAPYKASSGFERSKVEGNPEAAQMFKKSNLKGKQIWYFTAPASVPISAIKSMSLQNAKDGKPVMEHNEGAYAFLQDSTEDKTYTKILVPSSAEDGYRAAPQSIDQVIRLQQIVKLDGVVDDAPTKNHSCARLSKPGRQQPKGMKIRFRPLGFGTGNLGKIGSDSDGEADEEMEDAPAPVPEKRSSEASLKRKHSEGKEKESKHSSSDTTNIPENKKLKLSKKNTTESPIAPPKKVDRPLASTNIRESRTPSQPPKTSVPLPKTSVPLPKSSNPPQVLARAKGDSEQKPPKKKHHKPSTAEPMAKNGFVQKEESKETPGEKRKMKKMKHKAKRETREGSS